MHKLSDGRRTRAIERVQTLVELRWTAPDGGIVRERSVEITCRIGLLVCIQDYGKDLFPGCEVTVEDANVGGSFQAQVMEVRSISGGKFSTVALELLQMPQQSHNDA